MPHLRKGIRDAVVTALTGLTTTGANVFASRVWPVQRAEMPGLLVYTLNDAVNSGESSMDTITREVELTIEIHAESATTLDDTLDQIEVEVLDAIFTDAGVKSAVNWLEFNGTSTQLDQAGVPVGVTLLTFTAGYRHAEADATVAV